MSGETRKLQQVGGGTYTVSIPKEWATEQSLSAGEAVRVHPDGDGSLVVCREEGEEPASATVGIGELDADAVERTLRVAHAAGIERLTLTAPEGIDADARSRIAAFARAATGVRVVEEQDTAVTVRTSLDDAEVSIPRTVVQLQYVTLSLFRTVVEAALSGTDADGDRIADRRGEARRLSALVTRQFGRSLSRPTTAASLDEGRPEAFDCYRTAQALDGVAAHSADIGAIDGARIPADSTDTLRSVADETRRYIEEATTAVVDAAALEDAQTLDEGRATLSAAIEDAEAAVGDEGDAARLLSRLDDCVTAGDRIAAVAREAAIRRDSITE